MKIQIEKIIKNIRISLFIAAGHVFLIACGFGWDDSITTFSNWMFTSLFLFFGLVSYDFFFPDEKLKDMSTKSIF